MPSYLDHEFYPVSFSAGELIYCSHGCGASTRHGEGSPHGTCPAREAINAANLAPLADLAARGDAGVKLIITRSAVQVTCGNLWFVGKASTWLAAFEAAAKKSGPVPRMWRGDMMSTTTMVLDGHEHTVWYAVTSDRAEGVVALDGGELRKLLWTNGQIWGLARSRLEWVGDERHRRKSFEEENRVAACAMCAAHAALVKPHVAKWRIYSRPNPGGTEYYAEDFEAEGRRAAKRAAEEVAKRAEAERNSLALASYEVELQAASGVVDSRQPLPAKFRWVKGGLGNYRLMGTHLDGEITYGEASPEGWELLVTPRRHRPDAPRRWRGVALLNESEANNTLRLHANMARVEAALRDGGEFSTALDY